MPANHIMAIFRSIWPAEIFKRTNLKKGIPFNHIVMESVFISVREKNPKNVRYSYFFSNCTFICYQFTSDNIATIFFS